VDEDVGVRAEDSLLEVPQDNGLHLGVLETNAPERVVELDVDAEVVGVELERVALADAAVLRDVQAERRDRAVEAEIPVLVARRFGAVIDAGS
jgi:hypothetical protein